ncbi:hypothetical protein Afil01_53050 [Actinorhabdospora filicis]|uniref:Ricin B lectin domain-containing protein n=1 Tax=Actinorhabdospora filicis TaxID=1785913 RepID=A0A9W6WBW7_9ACTN|nr:ricin-type beta-trefoil lectin domain protein [Actinorhabdospora filicis]GLZ80498.1 hypothetical protein Afil01_53050 [Actinorhabdospora filicis]
MSPSHRPLRIRLTSVLATALLGLTALATAAPAQAAARPDPTPLPANLESVRAAEATALYGDPAIRPFESRKTALITMGDSEISGEGVGNYEPGTHVSGNYCDRSLDQAVFRVQIPADVRYNVACSGAASPHLRYGSGQHQWNELNQGDNLAIKARNTRLRLVWIVIGANDSGGIEFGPVATDCAKRRILFQGPCWPTYTDTWAAKVAVTRAGVEGTIDSVRQTMSDAGYLGGDYELVVMNYPSPGSPDVEDNPNFPGWYSGGCTLYLADAAFARNKAVPLFGRGVRDAALAKGVRFLDASRLFDGHGVCEDDTWARGVYVETALLPSEHAFRQSLHPNYRGHGAFAECMTQMWNTGLARATCVDPASTGHATLYGGFFDFKDLKSSTGQCVDAEGYNSRNDTRLVSWTCHGGRNQGFWYDATRGSLHVELSQDRCADVKGGNVAAGTDLILWNCHGGANQKFTLDGTKIHPQGRADLCLSLSGAGDGSVLELASCSAARTDFQLAARSYANPAGYGHDDWIGSKVY